MVHITYPAEFQLNKANASDTEAALLDLNLSMIQFLQKYIYIYIKQDFDIVNFPLLDRHVPRRASYGVYILRGTRNLSFFTYIKCIVFLFLP